MLFGRSVFQSILTRLDHEQPESAPAEEAHFRISGLPAGFVAQPLAAQTTEHASNAYRDFLGEIEPDGDAKPIEETAPPPPEARFSPVCPPQLMRLSETEIAEDLALRQDDSPEQLAEKRRRFARDNHPDRVHPLYRDQATARMTIANMLVDQALRLCALRR